MSEIKQKNTKKYKKSSKVILATALICLSYFIIDDSSSKAQEAQVFVYIFGAIGMIFGTALLWDVASAPKKDKKWQKIAEDDKTPKQEMIRQLQPSTHVKGPENNQLRDKYRSPSISI